MSIKKLLEKVAVGAAVGALVIAGAVGVVNSQTSPYVPGNPQNAALDVKRGSAELPIYFNVDLRAVLLAIPNLNLDGITDRLDDGQDVRGDSANVGWLFVETNYNAWDILVHRENGGYLVRDPYTGEDAKNFGGITVTTCVPVPGPFGSTTQDCSDETVGGKPGVALQLNDSLGKIKDLPIALAVGVMDSTTLGDKGAIMDRIKIGQRTIKNLTSRLKFDTSGVAVDYASFGNSLRDSITLNNTARTELEKFFASNEIMVKGTAAKDSVLFRQPKSAPKLRLDTEIGDPYNPVPKQTDGSIVFFINAKFEMDVTGSTNGTAEYLAGNRNGVYSENLVFTFYGLY